MWIELHSATSWLNKRSKGPHTCTWVQCATFFDRLASVAILFTIQLDKHKLGRGHWDLASCQVLLNSIHRFQRKSQNMSQPIRGHGRHIGFFFYRPEKHKLGRRRWALGFCPVSMNSVQQFLRRSQKCLSQSEARVAIMFFRSAW